MIHTKLPPFLKAVILSTFVLSAIACKNKTDKKTSEDSPAKALEEEKEWTYLFDGKTLEGWRGYGLDSLPPGWTIKDSILTFDTELGLEQNYKGGKDIIYGAEEFDNFELYLEWKIPEG